MKILLLINALKNNGPDRVIYDLAVNLPKSWDITVGVLFDESKEEVIAKWISQGISVHCFHINRKQYHKALPIVQAFVDTYQPDVIHSHTLRSDELNSRLNTSARKVSTIHNVMREDYRSAYGMIKGNLMVLRHRRCLKRIPNIIGVSQSASDDLVRFFPQVTTIYNGISPEPFEISPSERKEIRTRIRKQSNIPEDAVLFIYVGVLNARKNVAKLVELFARHRAQNEYLWILGDGPLKEELERNLPPGISLLGFQPPREYLLASDIYLSASKSEGYSISVLEALMSGLPVLLSDIPPHREVLKNAEEWNIGTTFTDDFETKKQQIVRTLSYNANQRQIFDRFGAPTMASRYRKIYRKGV